jgi:hypothetical protein
MSFTVEDFHDLIELLAQHPEWRAELRRHVLSDELLELPSLVRQLVEAQARAEARLEGVEQRLDRTETRLEGVEARLEGVEARLDRLESTVQTLAEAQTHAAQEIRALAVAQRRSEDRLGHLDGRMLEWEYAQRAPSYFGSIVRRLRIVEPTVLADLLDDAIDDGRLTWDERSSILLADLVMSGRRRDDGQDMYLLAELSVGIGEHDVERAIERARLLEKLGRPVLPVVAGEWINDEAARLARERGVWMRATATSRLTAVPDSGQD